MNKFIVNGQEYTTDQPKQEIEGNVQGLLDLQYGAGNIIFEYDLINDKEVKLSFKRDIVYGIIGDFLTSIDCSMITGCDLSAFEVDYLGDNQPLVHCFPFNNSRGEGHWYISTDELAYVYREELKALLNQKTKQVKVSANDTIVTVNIKFR
ncbi:hypothetical protein [uncultured Odoribacter sp.]|uniref:hypothetical protein n=1 Tax=uncultured Odoribacter sp. TaxID=876416 RepID=UPI0026236497|nr:hypothetical protein [uncultured Odoribacter sp.]